MTPAERDGLLAQAGWPPGLWRAAVPARDDACALWPDERSGLVRARAPRRADFVAGRIAARAALVRMGQPVCAIPQGAGRAPVWPEGIRGSITHAGGVAMAVVGRARDWAGLGLDLERDTPLDPDTAAAILRPDEPATDPLATFGAKEAAFKAQFPATGAMIGFDAARLCGDSVRLDGPGTDALPCAWRGRALPVRHWRVPGWILSLCAVPAGAAEGAP
ncbi:4'-phosphopantetheinyl transferase [Citreimonas sp.]|uniref:4'-phosphopantetheinyl transferase family protein n=1 Tax=Citreimonas sp. TaxID=3036715 RepID=UPI0035C7F096